MYRKWSEVLVVRNSRKLVYAEASALLACKSKNILRQFISNEVVIVIKSEGANKITLLVKRPERNPFAPWQTV